MASVAGAIFILVLVFGPRLVILAPIVVLVGRARVELDDHTPGQVTAGALIGAIAPIDAAAAGLNAIGARLQERRAFARKRSKIIAANAELQERELIKLASMAAALANALHERGIAEPAASLVAEVAIAVFRTAFERWVEETNQCELPELIRQSLDELKALTGKDRRSLASSAQPCAE